MRGIFHFAQMKNVCVSHSSEWMERDRKEAENIPVASARQANTFGHRSVDQLKLNPSQSFPDTTQFCKMHSAQLHTTKPKLSENIFSLNLLSSTCPIAPPSRHDSWDGLQQCVSLSAGYLVRKHDSVTEVLLFKQKGKTQIQSWAQKSTSHQDLDKEW